MLTNKQVNLFTSNGIKTDDDIDNLDCSNEEKDVLKDELEGITTMEYLEDDMVKCNPDYE